MLSGQKRWWASELALHLRPFCADALVSAYQLAQLTATMLRR